MYNSPTPSILETGGPIGSAESMVIVNDAMPLLVVIATIELSLLFVSADQEEFGSVNVCPWRVKVLAALASPPVVDPPAVDPPAQPAPSNITAVKVAKRTFFIKII
jgi:hypothetical protein